MCNFESGLLSGISVVVSCRVTNSSCVYVCNVLIHSNAKRIIRTRSINRLLSNASSACLAEDLSTVCATREHHTKMWSILLLVILRSQISLASTLPPSQGKLASPNALQIPQGSRGPTGSLLELTTDSIGVLFKTAEDGYVQTWLPRGERVQNGV